VTHKFKLIRCGKLIDGTGNPPAERTSILIDGSRITAVGPNLKVPEDALVIDASERTVIPGLIDAQVHLSGGVADGFGMEWEWVTRPRELRLIKSVYDARALLNSGFTMVRDCGSANAVFLRRSAEEGTLTGVPRIVAAGYVLTQTAGHMDVHSLPPDCVDARTTRHQGRLDSLICDGVPACIKATRYALRFGADFVMICAGGGVISEKDKPSDVQFHVDEIKAIVDVADQAGRYVAAHSLNTRGVENAIRAGVKTIIHSFEVNDQIIALGKERGTIFTSTLGVAFKLAELESQANVSPRVVEKARGHLECAIDTYTRIRRAGAILAAGTILVGAQELALLVEYCGFSSMEAIVAATRYGAMACFMVDDAGTLEAGKFADLLIVDGDPLDDIGVLQDPKRITMVILEGKIEVERESVS
jgi:imidazolonepropionase-like amidohydrolase